MLTMLDTRMVLFCFFCACGSNVIEFLLHENKDLCADFKHAILGIKMSLFSSNSELFLLFSQFSNQNKWIISSGR